MSSSSRSAIARPGLWSLAVGCALAAGCGREVPPTAPAAAEKPAPVDPEVLRAEALAKLAEEARPLVEACRKLGPPQGRVTRNERVLILDLETGKPRKAQASLPPEMQAEPGDPQFTLFLVVESHPTLVAEYASKDDAPQKAAVSAYRVDLDVAILRWPSQEPVGLVRRAGDPPPDTVSLQSIAGARSIPPKILGPIDVPLANWVASRPLVGAPDPVAAALAWSGRLDEVEPKIVARRNEERERQQRGEKKGKKKRWAYDTSDPHPKLERKALVWDASRDLPAARANRHLPQELRGLVSDEKLTLFLITAREGRAEGGEGLFLGEAAFDGYIVDWPEDRVAGRFRLSGAGLPYVGTKGSFQPDGQVASNPETTFEDTAELLLARWIDSLHVPTEEASGPKQP